MRTIKLKCLVFDDCNPSLAILPLPLRYRMCPKLLLVEWEASSSVVYHGPESTAAVPSKFKQIHVTWLDIIFSPIKILYTVPVKPFFKVYWHFSCLQPGSNNKVMILPQLCVWRFEMWKTANFFQHFIPMLLLKFRIRKSVTPRCLDELSGVL